MGGPAEEPGFAPQSGHVRVFVSSTFSDLVAERDYLARRVFPSIERRCHELGLMFSSIDLRWGITDEQVAEGAVLPICLDAIERSRPYFVGIVGDRYGWVPDEISETDLARHPWLADEQGKSITELEMVHGAISRNAADVNASFYARRPGPNAAEDERLEALKRRIRAAGWAIHEFSSLEELGRLVTEHFTRSLADVGSLDPAEDQARRHRLHARRALQGYVRRAAMEAELSAAAQASPVVALVGPPGSGTTALAAHWLDVARTRDPDTLAIYYSSGATNLASDWRELCRFVIGEVCRALGIQAPDVNEDDELRDMFAKVLEFAASQAPFALVLDACDRLDDDTGARQLAFLPYDMPAGCQLVFTAAAGSPTANHAGRQGWPLVRVTPLQGPERLRILASTLDQVDRSLDSAQMSRVASMAGEVPPAFITILASELTITASHANLDATLTDYLECQSTERLLSKVLARLEADYDRTPMLVRNVMIALWAAVDGLTDAELCAVASNTPTPLPMAEIARMINGSGSVLNTRQDRIVLAGSLVRRAVEDRYLRDARDRRGVYLRLAELLHQRDPDLTFQRTLLQLPQLWIAAEEWDSLHAFMSITSSLQALTEYQQMLPVRIWTVLARHGKDPLLTYDQAIEDPAVTYNELEAIATTLFSLGHLPAARRALARAVDIALEIGQPGDASPAAAALAYSWVDEEPTEARRYFMMALEDAFAGSDTEQAVRHMMGIGICHRTLGELEDAADWMRSAEQTAETNGHLDLLAMSLSSQADLASMAGAPMDDVVAMMERAAEAARLSGNEEVLTSILASLAMVRTDQGQIGESLELAREAERAARLGDADDISSLVGSLLGQGSALEERGEVEEALACYSEAADISRRNGLTDALEVALAAVAMTPGIAPSQALPVVRELVDISSVQDRPNYLKLLFITLLEESANLVKQGHPEQARMLTAQARETATTIGDDELLAMAISDEAWTWENEDPRKALMLYRGAERLYRGPKRKPRDAKGAADCLVGQARMATVIGEAGLAARFLSEAHLLYVKAKNRRGQERVARLQQSWSQATAPAAWYPDPLHEADIRYWDGAQWTEHTHDY